MTDFLLELLSEEIPARMQGKASAHLASFFEERLRKLNLDWSGTETYATPRRLALIVRGLASSTLPSREERKGPRADAPEIAIEGFLRSTGLRRDMLEVREDKKGVRTLYGVINIPGMAAADVLKSITVQAIREFPWPKSMRWGAASASTESLRWVRPLQGIVALFGEEIVDFEVAGIRSGAATVGHRFHHPGIITIGSAADYVEKLHACHVILDPAERRRIIAEGAAAAAREAGLSLVEDQGLLEENAGLTEWPVPLLGSFDPEFLQVPPEVIQLTMRTNQKYFACTDGEGRLAPNFICTANIEAGDGGQAIVEGNRKVLAARLSDARFFWEQDLKIKLEDQAKKLTQIVFHEKLGTVADKVDRVAKLARWLVDEGIVGTEGTLSPAGRGQGEGALTPRIAADSEPPHPNPLPHGERERLATLAERAARLCKADLVTQMVGEFPELQGLIGGYLARAQGEPDEVADAIRDHYKPVGQGDEVPTAPVTVAVSLADKLDTVFGFFALKEPPTGSKDPYALRRQILGIASLTIRNGLRLPLRTAFAVAGLAHAERYVSWMAEEVPTLPNWQRSYDAQRLPPGPEAMSRLHEIVGEAINEFLLSVPEVGEVPDDAFTRDVQGRRLGTMHRSFIISNLWISDWDQVSAASDASVAFAADRLKVQQREAGVRHDLIDAVFALGGEDDLVRLLARVRALQAFVETPEGADLLAGYKRAANILKKEGWGGQVAEAQQQGDTHESVRPERSRGAQAPDSEQRPSTSLGTNEAGDSGADSREQSRNISFSYTPEIEEAALIAALDSAEPRARTAVVAEDFEGAMAALASLRAPVDAFFDTVTVNDPDPAKRAARLDLLARMRAAVHQVADFSKIEG